MTRNGNSTDRTLAFILAAALALMLAVGCGEDSASQEGAELTGETREAGIALSDMASEGEDLFDANCSACHGESASGTNQGPTLIDRIYHPGHHSDASIRNAVSRGVQQHHWTFGDMASVAGVSPDDVEKIICYVRELQRADGIFEGDDFQTVC